MVEQWKSNFPNVSQQNSILLYFHYKFIFFDNNTLFTISNIISQLIL